MISVFERWPPDGLDRDLTGAEQTPERTLRHRSPRPRNVVKPERTARPRRAAKPENLSASCGKFNPVTMYFTPTTFVH